MIKCTNCSELNATDLKYCSNCGYQLPLEEATPAQKKIIKSSEKKALPIKTTIGFAVGFIVFYFASKFLFSPSFEKEFSKNIFKMNKNCPMVVDEFVTLDSITQIDAKTVQYNHTLVQFTKAEVNLDTVNKYIFSAVLENIKTNPDLKQFRENNVSFNYLYNDKEGIFIYTYKVNPEMYK